MEWNEFWTLVLQFVILVCVGLGLLTGWVYVAILIGVVKV